MLTLSPQVGELLLQATQSQDLEEALQKVLQDYTMSISNSPHSLPRLAVWKEKWGCPFTEFQEKTKGEYTYEVESTFWEWERLETLKSHYQALHQRS